MRLPDLNNRPNGFDRSIPRELEFFVRLLAMVQAVSEVWSQNVLFSLRPFDKS